MLLNQFLLLSAVLFSIGVYGVLARRNGVLVLMSIELILNAVNINLVAFGAFRATVGGEVFALFVIAVAAAEVGVGLAMVLLLYRNRRSIDLTAIAHSDRNGRNKISVVDYSGMIHLMVGVVGKSAPTIFFV